MIRSWSNSIPTEVVSGPAGYANITGAADLPRGFVGWVEQGGGDAGSLNGQFRKKRALEELARHCEAKREAVIAERRKMAEQLKEIERSPLTGLDRSLQSYFGGLRRAPRQADPRRSEALTPAQNAPSG